MLNGGFSSTFSDLTRENSWKVLRQHAEFQLALHIHRNIGQVGNHQKPPADECHFLPKTHFTEGELTARLRIFGNHIGITERDNDHHQCAENHRNRGSVSAGRRQKFLAGIDKASPTDNAAESDRPDVQRRKRPVKVCI